MNSTAPVATADFDFQKSCDYIKSKVRSIPDWPIKGVIFRDITTLLQDPAAHREVSTIFYNRYADQNIDKIVGIDARGFLFGSVLAYRLDKGFIPIRKKGKLPYETIGESYTLEYGEETVEIHADAFSRGDPSGVYCPSARMEPPRPPYFFVIISLMAN